jgi:hypothetical protein
MPAPAREGIDEMSVRLEAHFARYANVPPYVRSETRGPISTPTELLMNGRLSC